METSWMLMISELWKMFYVAKAARRSNGWVINSLLDLDFYKLTMLQVVYHYFRNVCVKYDFTNRKEFNIPDVVDIEDLRAQLDHARTLRVTNAELDYLRGLCFPGTQKKIFKEDFLFWFSEYSLPGYVLEKVNGRFKLSFFGNWAMNMPWETLALTTISELFYRAKLAKMSRTEQTQLLTQAFAKLLVKMAMIRQHPVVQGIIEFGTRRRFAGWWQELVVRVMAVALLPGQFVGTSNVKLAMKLGIDPKGTMAHELFMVLAALYSPKEAILMVIKVWEEEYGGELTIFLPDTWGTDYAFKVLKENLPWQQIDRWAGMRGDSGPMKEEGDRTVAFYEDLLIDPMKHVFVPSDGLDVQPIIDLAYYFQDRIQTGYGWGTMATCDMGLPTLAIVIKAVEAWWEGSDEVHGTCKISNNLKKATGKPEDVARYKELCGYTGTFSEACRV
ncbi:MAG: hypothetical protein ABIH67_05790 [Candidatus Uhrbacteria bacterium]